MKQSRELSRAVSSRGSRLEGRGAPPIVVLALMLMIVVLAGCKIQMALDTKVKTDGSGSIGVRLAADKEIQDLMAQQASEGDLFAEFKKQIPADWQSDSGTDADGTKWVSASKTFEDTAELDTLLAGQAQGGLGGALAGDTFSIKQSSSLFTVTTTFDATWDAGKALADAQTGISDTIPQDTLSSVFQVENRLTLPGTIKDNNATEVQGNTLVWRPKLQGATALHARSVAVRWGIAGAFIAAGALLMAVVVVVVVLVVTRRRRRAPLTPVYGAAEAAYGATEGREAQAEGTVAPPADPVLQTADAPPADAPPADVVPLDDVPPDANT